MGVCGDFNHWPGFAGSIEHAVYYRNRWSRGVITGRWGRDPEQILLQYFKELWLGGFDSQYRPREGKILYTIIILGNIHSIGCYLYFVVLDEEK